MNTTLDGFSVNGVSRGMELRHPSVQSCQRLFFSPQSIVIVRFATDEISKPNDAMHQPLVLACAERGCFAISTAHMIRVLRTRGER